MIWRWPQHAAAALLGLTPLRSRLFFTTCCAGAVRPAGAADNSGAARHATRAGRRAGPHLATAPHAHAVLNARLGLWPAHHPPCGRLRRWLPSDRLAHGLTPLFCTRGPFLANRRSEAHTSELQSLMRNSYAVFGLKKKKNL